MSACAQSRLQCREACHVPVPRCERGMPCTRNSQRAVRAGHAVRCHTVCSRLRIRCVCTAARVSVLNQRFMHGILSNGFVIALHAPRRHDSVAAVRHGRPRAKAPDTGAAADGTSARSGPQHCVLSGEDGVRVSSQQQSHRRYACQRLHLCAVRACGCSPCCGRRG